MRLLSGLVLMGVALADNMNARPYLIANGDSTSRSSYSTDYETEFFDVYSPLIQTRYSEVYWAMQEPVPLPPHIVDRFKDKVIAIRGYEVDQVRTLEDGTDVSVPITHAYNHHYCAWLSHRTEELDQELQANYKNHSYQWGRTRDKDQQFSTNEFISEGNGGEFRGSYHGYPQGYAQLLQSPDHLHLNPMQIDTWNRSSGESTLYHPGPLPKSSRIPHSAGYSGLIECPCNDLLLDSKKWGITYSTSDCQGGPIENAEECLQAAQMVVPSLKYVLKNQTKDTIKKSCDVIQKEDGTVDVLWNTEPSLATVEDSVVAFSSSQVNVTVVLTDTEATIRLIGPSNVWFGVGFGANSMCIHQQSDECPEGGPYAIIVTENGIEERKLDQHGPGHKLQPSLTLVSNVIQGGNRTLIMTRALAGATAEHFSFDKTKPTLDIIAARGCSFTFAQHCGHGSSSLFFIRLNHKTPLCRSSVKGTIGGQRFDNNRCADAPISDLKRQGNPTCAVQTYKGGLSCCRHKHKLLDADQEIPWKDQLLEYRFKFRFYYEDYKPATSKQPASHHHLTRVCWITEAFAGEYDIPQCGSQTPPDQCVHVITSHFQVRQAVGGDLSGISGLKLIYAGPHCHAPSCLSMDLYNADTGELLCHVEPAHGKSGELYYEKGFIAIPPCLWGNEDGLVAPKFLSLNTTLMSVKRNNNTLPHTGEMAYWQMRAVLVPKEELQLSQQETKHQSVERTAMVTPMLRPVEPYE